MGNPGEYDLLSILHASVADKSNLDQAHEPPWSRWHVVGVVLGQQLDSHDWKDRRCVFFGKGASRFVGDDCPFGAGACGMLAVIVLFHYLGLLQRSDCCAARNDDKASYCMEFYTIACSLRIVLSRMWKMHVQIQ